MNRIDESRSERPGEAPTAPTRWQRHAPVLVLVVALAVRLGLVLLAPNLVPENPDKLQRYDPIAASLLSGDGFSRDGRPTAVSPPVYPVLLAGVYAVTGPSRTAGRGLLAVLDALTCVLFFAVATRLLGRSQALLTGLVLALCPYQLYLVMTGGTDIAFLFLHGVFLLTLVGAVATRNVRGFLAAGVGVGLATLCRATSLLLPAALVPAALIAARMGRRRALAALLAFVGAFVVTLTPWTVRNAVQFHRFIPVQTLGGVHLLWATTDAKERAAWVKTGRGGEQLASPIETFDGNAYKRAVQRILDDPPKYLRQVGRRLVTMWSASHSGRLGKFLRPLNGVLLALAGLGLWFERERFRRLLPLIALVAYYVAVHSVITVIFRYMLPVVPVLVMLASVPCTLLVGKVRARFAR